MLFFVSEYLYRIEVILWPQRSTTKKQRKQLEKSPTSQSRQDNYVENFETIFAITGIQKGGIFEAGHYTSSVSSYCFFRIELLLAHSRCLQVPIQNKTILHLIHYATVINGTKKNTRTPN